MGKFLLTLFLFPLIVFSLNYEEIKKAYWQSYLYEKIGDYKNAIRVLMPVYEAYPNGYTVNLRLGWLYYLLGKYKNSIYHYKKADKVIPSSVETKLGLSLPLMAQQRWNESEQILYRVLSIDFYNYYGNLRLCKVLEKEKKYKQQLTIALKMLAIYPTSVPFLLEEAKAYYYLGNLKASEKIFKDILILDPENLIAKEFLKKISQKEEEGKGKPSKEKEKSNQS
jgi:tetratricopeptide (TPR) repeat protein